VGASSIGSLVSARPPTTWCAGAIWSRSGRDEDRDQWIPIIARTHHYQQIKKSSAEPSFFSTLLEGFIVAGHAQVDSFNLAFLAHEIGHQWWADCVYATGRANSLLTEAMAQYASLRAVEAIYGAEAAKEFRWRGYPGTSMFEGGRGYTGLMIAGVDASLSGGSMPMIAANKGVLIPDLLARVVGREQFREFLRGFVRAHAFQDVTWSQFVNALTARGGVDLRWFFEQWYDREVLPELAVSWTQRDGQLRGVVTQSVPHYRAEIDVLVAGGGHQLSARVRLDAPRTEFILPVAFPVTLVTLDPDYEVPHVTKERRAEAEMVRAAWPSHEPNAHGRIGLHDCGQGRLRCASRRPRASAQVHRRCTGTARGIQER
jgi:hypothetical protein